MDVRKLRLCRKRKRFVDDAAASVSVERVNVTFVRQVKVTRGPGDAVLRARSFTGDEPFIVLYGDDIIFSETKPVSTTYPH